jgi:transposase InsO family protein
VQLLRSFLVILITVVAQCFQFLRLALSPRTALIAEILFLRKQLVFYQEHRIPPRKLTAAARFSLVLWSRLFDWRNALMIVQPETLIGWHRQGFRLWWRWKSRLGRPRIPKDLRRLIVRMVQENPTWGEERVAAELSVKLGFLVSPRTVRAYWPHDADPKGRRKTSSQHWRCFVRNHAQAMVAADFLVAITAGFRVLYVLVVMEIGSRRILHCNVTAHPTASWTLQQFREAVPGEHSYRFLIHDRDSIFSTEVDKELQAFGLKVLRTPVQAPKANAYCERLMGTIRRECLDYVIPLSEKHLRTILREWVAHYNQGRPHSSLGPGIPDLGGKPFARPKLRRHELPAACRLRSKDVLGGLHHEYWLEEIAA